MFHMQYLWSFLIILILNAGAPAAGKRYMRCELTRLLVETYKFDKTFLSNWICLIEHESELDTKKVTTNTNGSKNYGLFQIDSKKYCQENRTGGLCNKKCQDFTDDNIGDDVICANLIRNNEGFKYWSGWNRFCRNTQNLPNLAVACNLRELSPIRSARNIYSFFRTQG